jgi:TRAP transporter TAXI family solute receptor
MNATKRHVILGVVVISVVAQSAAACRQTTASALPRPVVRVLSSPLADQFESLPFADQLAQEYARLLPEFDIRIVRKESNALSLLNNEGDLSVSNADTAYSVNARAGQLSTGKAELRAIGTLQPALLHLLVRPESEIHSIADLRGRAVGMAEADPTAELVLKAFHLDGTIVRKAPLSRTKLEAALLSGELDAIFVRNLFPATFVQNAISAGAQLLSIDGVALDSLPFEYPFLHRVSIPPGVYVGQTRRVRTIAIDVVLVCPSTLDENIVYQLTKHLFDAVARIPNYHRSLRLLEMQSASTTSIPLHDGAARYYREWELFR